MLVWNNRWMALAAKQSEKSRQTDLKVAQSAARAVHSVGVDQMALTRVAADAGFSSGAIYARCDDRSELVVLAWEKSFWPMLSEILVLMIDGVTKHTDEQLPHLSELFLQACSPDAVPDLGSAMEVIIASRRDEVIGEVVQRDFNKLLDDYGVGPSTDGAMRQHIVASISTLMGAALLNTTYNAEGQKHVNPSDLLIIFAQSWKYPTKPAISSTIRKIPRQYEIPTTHDDVRDALITATEYVISRSGVHRATVSRIARRAGVSVGAIYGIYENKEALVSDCLEVLFPPQNKRDVEDWIPVFTATDQRSVLTDILSNYMSPSYEQWRRFRLECLVAARHSPPILDQLVVYATRARKALVVAAAKAPSAALIRPSTGLSARATVLGLSIFEIIDPTIRQLDWRWLPINRGPSDT